MIWSKGKSVRTPRTPRTPKTHTPAGLFESLEPRAMLYQVPMATGFVALTSLEDRNNSVVRIITNVGRIDIELFEALVPSVTANFRNYITSGKHDEEFFHSMAAGVLQSGKYKFNDGTGLATVTPNSPISNGFSRSNLQRTVSMVPINTIQADSQFIINLQDNLGLNTLSGGYTVFGKVIQGWDIVTTIAGFTVRDLNVQLTGSGTGPFSAVPTTPAYNPGNGPTENTLVKIVDVETIKAPGVAGYYSNTFVFPEGSRGAATTERLDIMNEDLDTNANNLNFFQIIIRYESGERDQVLYTGSLLPGRRFSFKVNDVNIPGFNLVRSGVGYAFDVRSTRKMAVSLDHRDTGVTLAESFQMTPQIPVPQFTRYNFPYAKKSATENAFLLLQELDGKNITINVLVYPASGGSVYLPVTLEAFRRGGINFNNFAQIPDGDFSILVTCLTPINAALSQFKTSAGVTEGSTQGGVQGLGRVEGALAGAYIATGGEAKINVNYTSAAAVVIVDFTITLTNGTVLTPSPVTLTLSNRRGSIDLTTIPGLPRDQYFAIQYSERQHVNPVSVSYYSKVAGDEMSTPFQINGTPTVMFADGFTDPNLVGSNGMSETISIFNPYANAGVTFVYDILFQFSDGTQLFAAAPGIFSLGALQRRDHRAANIPAVLAKINSDPAFRFYSVQVITAAFGTPVPIGGVVAQLTRLHNTWGQSLTTIPSLDPSHAVVYLDNVEFN